MEATGTLAATTVQGDQHRAITADFTALQLMRLARKDPHERKTPCPYNLGVEGGVRLRFRDGNDRLLPNP